MRWAEGVKFYVAAVVGATLWKLWAFTRQAFFDECGVFAARRHRPFQSGWSVRAKRPLGARRCLNLARRRHHFRYMESGRLSALPFPYSTRFIPHQFIYTSIYYHLPTSRAPHYHCHHHHLISFRNRRTSPISCHAISHLDGTVQVSFPHLSLSPLIESRLSNLSSNDTTLLCSAG